jgi:hypothetical protein
LTINPDEDDPEPLVNEEEFEEEPPLNKPAWMLELSPNVGFNGTAD